VQVRYDEGVAIRIGLEPCADAREGGSEASVGDCVGQPLSPEKILSRTPTFLRKRKATRRDALVQAPRRSGVVGDPGMRRRSLFREPGDPTSDLGVNATMVRVGKVRSRSRQ
jgi:hypothetical protein